MYAFLQGLLEDKKSTVVFECFGIWHIIYMAIIFGAIATTIFFLKKKSKEFRVWAVNNTAGIALGLYIADFFLMPFAYGEIDIEKLPFHAYLISCSKFKKSGDEKKSKIVISSPSQIF